jgi:hypothetical protein
MSGPLGLGVYIYIYICVCVCVCVCVLCLKDIPALFCLVHNDLHRADIANDPVDVMQHGALQGRRPQHQVEDQGMTTRRW